MKNVNAYDLLKLAEGDLLDPNNPNTLLTHYSYLELANRIIDDLITYAAEHEDNASQYIVSQLKSRFEAWNRLLECKCKDKTAVATVGSHVVTEEYQTTGKYINYR